MVPIQIHTVLLCSHAATNITLIDPDHFLTLTSKQMTNKIAWNWIRQIIIFSLSQKRKDLSTGSSYQLESNRHRSSR